VKPNGKIDYVEIVTDIGVILLLSAIIIELWGLLK